MHKSSVHPPFSSWPARWLPLPATCARHWMSAGAPWSSARVRPADKQSSSLQMVWQPCFYHSPKILSIKDYSVMKLCLTNSFPPQVVQRKRPINQWITLCPAWWKYQWFSPFSTKSTAPVWSRPWQVPQRAFRCNRRFWFVVFCSSSNMPVPKTSLWGRYVGS